MTVCLSVFPQGGKFKFLLRLSNFGASKGDRFDTNVGALALAPSYDGGDRDTILISLVPPPPSHRAEVNEPVLHRVRVPKESDPGAEEGEGEEEQMFARDAKTVSLGGLQRPSVYMTALKALSELKGKNHQAGSRLSQQ